MSTSTFTVAARVQGSQDWTQWYYRGAACVMLVAVLVGFQQFFLHGKAHPGRELTPQIRTLIIAHGIAMTGWVLTFVTQTFLIAAGRRRAHRTLGRMAAVLATCIFLSGLWLTVASFRLVPPDFVRVGLNAKQSMLLGFSTLFQFAGFLAVALHNRGRPAVHRPLMMLTTLSIMPPALNRIDALHAITHGTAWESLFGSFSSTVLLGAILLVVNWRLFRKIDHAYAIGFGVLAVTQVLTIQVARTAIWDRVASFLLR